MTIENIYTVRSSFLVKFPDNERKIIEETDIVKANAPEIAVAWVRAYYEGVWKDDLCDWIFHYAKPVFITDLSHIPEC